MINLDFSYSDERLASSIAQLSHFRNFGIRAETYIILEELDKHSQDYPGSSR